jgi:hypothetical protein
MFLGNVDIAVVNVAAPSIRADLHARRVRRRDASLAQVDVNQEHG